MESGQSVKVRHSRYSRIRLAEAGEALAIVHTITNEFAAQVSQLAATTVTDRQWAAFLDAHAVLPSSTSTRTRTTAWVWPPGHFLDRPRKDLSGARSSRVGAPLGTRDSAAFRSICRRRFLTGRARLGTYRWRRLSSRLIAAARAGSMRNGGVPAIPPRRHPPRPFG
jgi:hypothetical protein